MWWRASADNLLVMATNSLRSMSDHCQDDIRPPLTSSAAIAYLSLAVSYLIRAMLIDKAIHRDLKSSSCLLMLATASHYRCISLRFCSKRLEQAFHYQPKQPAALLPNPRHQTHGPVRDFVEGIALAPRPQELNPTRNVCWLGKAWHSDNSL